MSPTQMLVEFIRASGGKIPPLPMPVIDRDTELLCARLIHEEHSEVIDAIEEEDHVKIAKELADLAYVTFYAAVKYGIDLDQVFTAVHQSNMSKFLQCCGTEYETLLPSCGNDEPHTPHKYHLKREDGKVLKGPNYQPAEPTIALLLESQGRL